VHICAATADARTMVHRCIQYMIHPVRAHTCKHTHTRTRTHTHAQRTLVLRIPKCYAGNFGEIHRYTLHARAHTHTRIHNTHTHSTHFSATQKNWRNEPHQTTTRFIISLHMCMGGGTHRKSRQSLPENYGAVFCVILICILIIF